MWNDGKSYKNNYSVATLFAPTHKLKKIATKQKTIGTKIWLEWLLVPTFSHFPGKK